MWLLRQLLANQVAQAVDGFGTDAVYLGEVVNGFERAIDGDVFGDAPGQFRADAGQVFELVAVGGVEVYAVFKRSGRRRCAYGRCRCGRWGGFLGIRCSKCARIVPIRGGKYASGEDARCKDASDESADHRALLLLLLHRTRPATINVIAANKSRLLRLGPPAVGSSGAAVLGVEG